MAIESYRLTTIDNPFDPFEQFNDWYLYDMGKGYNTCEILSRMSADTSELTEEEAEEENLRAINDVLAHDPYGLYIRVRKGAFKKPKTSDVDVIFELSDDSEANEKKETKEEKEKVS